MTEITVAETAAGTTLVGPDGMTLYIFTNDTDGVSNCSGDCATNWPPLVVTDDDELAAGDGVTGELDTIERDDGSLQVTYDGAPLYYFAGDSAAGDSNGEGVGGVWFIASPDGAAAAATNAYDY
jgi:predicted lipoprotein with Yx(FWY)xxD motif